eukprot:8875447-Pyramimonas_sp.AAC.1
MTWSSLSKNYTPETHFGRRLAQDSGQDSSSELIDSNVESGGINPDDTAPDILASAGGSDEEDSATYLEKEGGVAQEADLAGTER